MEVSQVRKQVISTIERARQRAQQRRQRNAEAEHEFRTFLDAVAVPLVRQLSQALKAEGHHFAVFTPSGGVRLAAEHGRDDYIELTLDTSGEVPQVMGQVHRTRGSRTVTSEAPVKAGILPSGITDADLLAFLLDALEPWLER